MIIIFFVLTFSLSLKICEIPPVFHGFDNCINVTCRNEGLCQSDAKFITDTNPYEDISYNNFFVVCGESYEGQCFNNIYGLELLMSKPPKYPDVQPHLFFIQNLRFKFFEDRVLIFDNGNLLSDEMCVDSCIKTNSNLYHVFILLHHHQNNTINVDVYVNNAKIFSIKKLLIFYQHVLKLESGMFYHYALYDRLLDTNTINRFTDIGINRKATDNYCVDIKNPGEDIFNDMLTQESIMWWWFFGIFFFMIIMLFVALIIIICVKSITKYKVV